jgi:hypothetical protein
MYATFGFCSCRSSPHLLWTLLLSSEQQLKTRHAKAEIEAMCTLHQCRPSILTFSLSRFFFFAGLCVLYFVFSRVSLPATQEDAMLTRRRLGRS